MQFRLTLNLRNCWQWPGTWSSCHCLISAGITGVHNHTWLVVFTVFWPFWKGVLLACPKIVISISCALGIVYVLYVTFLACTWLWMLTLSVPLSGAGAHLVPSPRCQQGSQVHLALFYVRHWSPRVRSFQAHLCLSSFLLSAFSHSLPLQIHGLHEEHSSWPVTQSLLAENSVFSRKVCFLCPKIALLEILLLSFVFFFFMYPMLALSFLPLPLKHCS